MVRCPNCGQETSGDYCQWCKYPIQISSTTRQRKAEKRAKEGAKDALMRASPPILCLLSFTLAEWITAGVNLIGGLIFHLIIFFCLILYAFLTTQRPGHKLYLSLSLAPMIRILSLSIPLAQFSQIYWYLIVAIPVLAGAFTVIRLLNYRPSEVGLSFRKIPRQVLLQGVVALDGIGFGIVEYLIFTPEPLVPSLTWERLWLPSLILLVATGFTEELVFRGVIQRSSMEVLGTGGLLYTAVVFSVFHVGYLSWMHCGFVFLVGLFFGLVVERTGSIVGVSLSHGISNICLYLIFPFVLTR